jgi:Protein of unknown function (DUF2889)
MLDDLADDQLQPLHHRTYAVQVFRRDAHCIVVRGIVHDVKPPGMHVEDDPDPLTMHRMRVELEIDYPALVIRAADVEFDDFPQTLCPMIADDYGALVGVSITRGFTHRVRELFGGPRGCAHVTALLQAMAPAVVQSTWSMGILNQRETTASDDQEVPAGTRRQSPPADSCHVWAADGDLVRMVAGRDPAPDAHGTRPARGPRARPGGAVIAIRKWDQ